MVQTKWLAVRCGTYYFDYLGNFLECSKWLELSRYFSFELPPSLPGLGESTAYLLLLHKFKPKL